MATVRIAADGRRVTIFGRNHKLVTTDRRARVVRARVSRVWLTLVVATDNRRQVSTGIALLRRNHLAIATVRRAVVVHAQVSILGLARGCVAAENTVALLGVSHLPVVANRPTLVVVVAGVAVGDGALRRASEQHTRHVVVIVARFGRDNSAVAADWRADIRRSVALVAQ
jgi:hypothetical protein